LSPAVPIGRAGPTSREQPDVAKTTLGKIADNGYIRAERRAGRFVGALFYVPQKLVGEVALSVDPSWIF
jgi:hypothetical protein